MLALLTKDGLRQDSTPKVYARGQDLHRSDSVYDLVRRGDRLQAKVTGSLEPYYQVTFEFQNNAIAASSCTCAYDWAGLCKHRVAVGLTVLKYPDAVRDRPTLDELLKSLNPQNLYQWRSQRSTWQAVLEAAATQRPQWLKDWTPEQVEDLLGSGQSQDYELAVTWLGYLKAAYEALDDGASWESYLTRLKLAHGRKRKFIGLMGDRELS